ncbi:glycine cleavage T C-terminal barrel domain-containing protein [Luedemannella flava]
MDPSIRLPEGSHLVTDGVPVGHVTSSYHSETLGRTFALALLTSGRHRHGETLAATLLDGPKLRTVPVTVVSPVLHDPDNTRRDGDRAEPVALSASDAARRPLAAFAGDGVHLTELPLFAQLNVRAPAWMPPSTAHVTATPRPSGWALTKPSW